MGGDAHRFDLRRAFGFFFPAGQFLLYTSLFVYHTEHVLAYLPVCFPCRESSCVRSVFVYQAAHVLAYSSVFVKHAKAHSSVAYIAFSFPLQIKSLYTLFSLRLSCNARSSVHFRLRQACKGCSSIYCPFVFHEEHVLAYTSVFIYHVQQVVEYTSVFRLPCRASSSVHFSLYASTLQSTF